MAGLAELRMNTEALFRFDPYIRIIKNTASHVALYKYNLQKNEWELGNIDGPLFIYSRKMAPFHVIYIMNRLGTENLVEPVMQGLKIDLRNPYLLYMNRTAINCVWFYDEDEFVRTGCLLEKLVGELPQDEEGYKPLYRKSTAKTLNERFARSGKAKSQSPGFSEGPHVPLDNSSEVERSRLQPELLDKNHILQALSYLFKNDPNFINEVHAAYIKSVSELDSQNS